MLTIGFSLAIGIGLGALVVGRAAFRHIDQLRAAHRDSYAALYERYHAVCVQADQHDQARHDAEQRAGEAWDEAGFLTGKAVA